MRVKQLNKSADINLFRSLTEGSGSKNTLKDELSPDSKPLNRQPNSAQYAGGKTAMGDVERPTDGRTAMPKELQLKKNAEAVAARQKALVQQQDAKNERKSDSDGDVTDDDQFAGTHLHHLMTTRKSVWSLAGVFGIKIKSSTRAAAGFGPPTPLVLDRSRKGTSQHPPLQGIKDVHETSRAVTESSDDEDDLDGPAHQAPTHTNAAEGQRPEPNRESSKPQGSGPNKDTKNNSTRTTVEKRKWSPVRQSQKPSVGFKSRMQSLLDDLDELPEPSGSNTISISDKKKGHLSANKTPERGSAENNLESKKSRSHNVPTFFL